MQGISVLRRCCLGGGARGRGSEGHRTGGSAIFRSRAGLSAVAGVILSLLAPAGLPPAGAATLLRAPTLSISEAVPGQVVQASGALPTKVVRPVKLQRKSGLQWSVVSSKKTTRTGKYGFSFTAPATTAKYRVVAPVVRVNGKRYASLATGTATLRVMPEEPEEPEEPLPPQFVQVSKLSDGTVVHPGASQLLAMASDGSAGLWSKIDGSFEFPRHDLQLWSRSTGKTAGAADPPQAAGEGWYPSAVSDDLRFVTYEVVRRMETGRLQWSLRMWDRSEETVSVIHPFIDDYYEPGVGTFLYTGLYIKDITADGRYVLYESNLESSTLVLWDRTDGSSVQITDSRSGFPRLNGSRMARVSDDGRYVVFNGSGNTSDPEAPEWEQGVELARWDRTGPTTIIRAQLPDQWVNTGTTWGGWTHLGLMHADGSVLLVRGYDADSVTRWGFLETATGSIEEVTLPPAPAGTVGELMVTGMSPDGGSLALEAYDWQTDTIALFTWQVDASAPVAITETGFRRGQRLWMTNGGRQAMYWSPLVEDRVGAMSGILFWDADKIE